MRSTRYYLLSALLLPAICLGDGLLSDSYGFAFFSYPGAAYTSPSGINNAGQVVGNYSDAAGLPQGFEYSGDGFSTVNYPGWVWTGASAINNSGQVVGQFRLQSGAVASFVKTGLSYVSISYPRGTETDAYAINDSGEITGIYFDGTGAHSFTYTAAGFDTFNYPGSQYTLANGINDKGQIVGIYVQGGESHGFLKTGSTYTTISGPSEFFSQARPRGVNDEGDIVGTNTFDGFLDTAGEFQLFGVPCNSPSCPIDGYVTYPQAINDKGEITGYLNGGPAGETIGFLAVPNAVLPEPHTIYLSFIALMLILALRWRNSYAKR